MAKKPLFGDGVAIDPGYVNVRSGCNEWLSSARKHCEELWEVYEPYADKHFLTGIRRDFLARYWEMYLTVYFVKQGCTVLCPKPGPDVGIEVNGRKIWFEATCPLRGKDGTADQVPERKFASVGERPVVQDVPNEKMVLRYLNIISTKYNDQYLRWLQNKTIGENDAFIIAINPRNLQFDTADATPPRLLQAAFSIGDFYMTIHQATGQTTGSGYRFRDAIAKSSGSSVPTAVFQNREYAGLSGLLCSRVDPANRPRTMGADFQLVPNPNARNPLSADFRLKGTYFDVERREGSYLVRSEESQ